MQYTYFPVTLDQCRAKIRYHDIVEGTFDIDDIKVSTHYLNHPALTITLPNAGQRFMSLRSPRCVRERPIDLLFNHQLADQKEVHKDGLFTPLRWRIKSRMRFCVHARLRRIASGLMLLAMVAFVHQSAMIAASQALASAGSMSDPAVTLSGSVHYHNSLARHVHVHGSHDSVGHVHDTADIDETNMPLWSLGCTPAVIPVTAISAVSSEIVRADECPHVRLEGIRPDGLNRPPSTPSIA